MIHWTAFDRAFDALFARWSAAHPRGPRQEHDPEWTSPCETGDVDSDGFVTWRPVLRDVPADLTGLEKLAQKPLPESLVRLLGSRYFGSISARCLIDDERVPVSLRSIWNDDDLARRLAGMEAEIRNSREETGRDLLCIANTEDDRFFAVSLESGAVTLEDYGRDAISVATSLEAFLDLLLV